MTMMSDLRGWVIDSGLFTGHKIQIGQWVDTGIATDKFLVIQQSAGTPATLTRGANFRVLIVQPVKEAYSIGDLLADEFIKAMQTAYNYGQAYNFTPSDAVYYATADSRNVWEINVAAATS